MEEKKKCTRLGCQKEYYEKDNVEGCCHSHDGKPIFHDRKKRWTCDRKIVEEGEGVEKGGPRIIEKQT